MLSEAFGLPDHDRVPTELASRFDTPEKADALAADIIKWCRWMALPPAERGEAAGDWWLRGHVNQAEAALDRFMASLKGVRTAGVADWLKGQGVIREAVRAKWMELTRQERREHIREVARGDWVSLNFDERKNLVGNAMLRRWTSIPRKEQTSSITALVRGAWFALGTDERAAMETQWLDGLPAYAGNQLWLAWRWHSESEAPVRPALLVATAAVLALVARKWDGKGRPVPASAIREILGLPSYDNLPAFLRAARLIADAARRGETETDVELGKLVGVTSVTIGKWRPDLARFANSTDDHFFPLGLEGLPDVPAMSWEEIRTECATVEEDLSAARQERAKSGERRKRQPRALKVEPRMALFRVAVQLARHDLSVPPTFLRALATTIGMNSSTNGRPLIAPDVLKGLGVPRKVKSMSLLREAARRDGEALRDHVMDMTLEDGRTFATAWTDARGDKAQSGSLRDWFFAMVSRKLDDGWLNGGAALQPLTLARDIDMDDNGRNTIRDDWRPLPEYRRLVHTAATAAIMTEAVWRGQNRKAV